MSEERNTGVRVLLSICILVAGYLVAYLLLVQRMPPGFMSGLPPWPRTPHYRIGGARAEAVFAPACWIDRQLFPTRWQVTMKDIEKDFR